ncbi:glycosyltransferase family 4 protein [Aerophototrophica crusticola]|uniref:Glycosyltransferase family 4 protein n=1 Tax=Aerophototrophica crusticola TaxID=1709002 RepID=A0A858R6S2_9PROT|nr:glycosyltransferase family 4 protein [Rhodospirillaceae bacterium B3]
MAGGTVALLPWGNVVEDFLDPIGLTVDDFEQGMTGGWLFGYAQALAKAGWRTVIAYPSRAAHFTRTNEMGLVRTIHAGSGAVMVRLPVPPAYAKVVRRVRDPYGWTAQAMFGPVPRPLRPAADLLRQALPYMAFPGAALEAVLRGEGCTALMVQEYEYARFDLAVRLGRRMGIPVFATFQGGDGHPPGIEDRIRPRSLKSAAGLVVGSGAELERLKARYGLDPCRLHRIGNPLDLRIWQARDKADSRAALGIPEGARVVVCHGRVEIRRKGLDLLLAAWRQVAAARPGQDIRLLLLGDGADGDRLQALLAADPVPGLTWNRGYTLDRKAVVRALSAADAYVIASRQEGFPVAPLEAMACGLPVVAAETHGIRDVLAEGEGSGGLLVPPEDPDALAAALLRLLDDPPRARALGERARARVEREYALEPVGKRLAAVLNP